MLLLDGVLADPLDFREAYAEGFAAHTHDFADGDMPPRTWHTLHRWIVQNMVRRYDAHELATERALGSFPSLSWRGGFVPGWLSAFSLNNHHLAQCGVELIMSLIVTCRQQEASR